MVWFKVDDGFYDHPKIENLSMASIGLWTKTGTWCAKHLTDGVISAKRVRALGGTPAQIRGLIETGLWDEFRDESGAKCYAFHDWNDMQPSSDQVYEKREIERQKKRNWRANRTNNIAPERGKQENVHGGQPGGLPTGRTEMSPGVSRHPDPTRPDPSLSSLTPLGTSPERVGEADSVRVFENDFQHFWDVYPRPANRTEAESAWREATQTTDPKTIIDVAETFRDDPGRVERFTPYPAKWLRNRGWENPPAPPPEATGRRPFGTMREDWDKPTKTLDEQRKELPWNREA